MNAASEGPTLSLCLIVRDGESTLGRALESARPFVDEMVVVDTGSVDRTPDIARALGARVEVFPWRDDFSAARNASLGHARGRWIFWMDADDVLPPESGRLLRGRIDEHPAQDAAFWVAVEQHAAGPGGPVKVTAHEHVKLFPNHPEIRFRYRVHEQVLPSIRRLGLAVKPSGASVRHAREGGGTPEDQERRIARNWRLLQLDLADHPDDPAVLLNLGLTAQHWPDRLAEAVGYVRLALATIRAGSTARLNAWLVLADAHARAREDAAQSAALEEALAEYPDDGNLLCRRGGLAERMGEPDLAIAMYRRALARGTIRLGSVHLRDLPVRAALRLGHLELAAGRAEAARAVWAEMLAKHPDDRLRDAIAGLDLRPFVAIAGPGNPPGPSPNGEGCESR